MCTCRSVVSMMRRCACPAAARAENGCSAVSVAPAAVEARTERRVMRKDFGIWGAPRCAAFGSDEPCARNVTLSSLPGAKRGAPPQSNQLLVDVHGRDCLSDALVRGDRHEDEA